jgi:hypothetical protein
MGLFSRRTSVRTNFIVISLLMVGIGLGLMFMSLRSRNYLETEGTVIESTLVRTRKGGTKAHIRYVYGVNDVKYDNDTVSYSLTMLRDKDELMDLYPVGKRVPVYYSITDPSYSVLEKGFSFGAFGLFSAGVLLFVGIRIFRS